MGKVSFPLHNVRKDILNNWHLKHLTEEIQVPEEADEYGFFTVSLTEIPESSSGSSIKIEGLTEFRSSPYDSKNKKYVLPQNQFWVNYFNGSIMFHRNQAGNTFVVQYDGKGSLVEADDVNDLNERVESNTSAISSLQETSTNFQQAVEEVESLKTSVNNLSGSVEEVNSSIDSINTALNNKVDNSSLESSIDGVRSLIESYVQEGGEVDELVNSKLLQYTPAAEFNSVKTTVEQNTADIETLKNSVENIDTIKANVEDVETNVGRIASNLEAIEANASRIGEVATELETVKTAAGKNTEDVASLTSRVTTLEGNEYVTEEDLNDLASKNFVTEKISEIEIPDTSDFVKPADFAGLVSIKGTNASSAQHKIITKKNDKNITAMLWNEESGGGSQMKNENAGKVSFIGVNNGDDGSNVWMQGYAKSISTNVGSRITLNPEGFYYTKNQANGSFSEDDEVVVKKDLPVIPDLSNFATKDEIPSVEGLASEEFVTTKISEIEIPDVSGFVTSSDVEAAISAAGHVKPSELSGLVAVNGTNVSSAQHKIVTKKNDKNLTAMLWNESSGGGAQFKNEDADKVSFIGVNNGDGDQEIWVQGYAKKISNNTGTRITLSTDGFYYTKNQANGSYTANDEVVVKKDVADFVKPSDFTGLVAVKGTNASTAQHKIVTQKNNKNLTSMIWNESSGGGAQFKNENVGKVSFIGVNNGDGDNEIWVQGYAKNIANNTGTRITLSTEGFFYTKNQANGSYTANNEVLTKADYNELDALITERVNSAILALKIQLVQAGVVTAEQVGLQQAEGGSEQPAQGDDPLSD